jgi:hypothetical protein
MKPCNRYVLGREHNVVHVDFGREPDPPAPKFPGAAALRSSAPYPPPFKACGITIPKMAQLMETKSWASSN